MNKIIKFRAWDKKSKKMHYPDTEQYGFQFKGDDWGFVDFGCNCLYTRKESGVLMQYTGLEDKNGKEIYENDLFETILGDAIFMFSNGKSGEHIKRIGEVKFKFGRFVIEFLDEKNELVNSPLYEFLKKNQKIILGNCFENPELLKCEICEGKGYTLEDYPDHHGEHQQTKIPCECQLEEDNEE